MKRDFYLDLARGGLRMPIGTDLVLHECQDAEAVLVDGKALGRVMVDAARRYRTPLALPVMDLRVEQALMLKRLGITDDAESFHFGDAPGDDAVAMVHNDQEVTARHAANLEAIRFVAQHDDLAAVGMVIGPFSLLTKLIDDPITTIFLAGDPSSADEPEAKLARRVIDLAVAIVGQSIRDQVRAGAKIVCVCEPAANKLFISPNQLAGAGDVFDLLVMRPNLRLRGLLESLGADLMFHDCGELVDDMLKRFNALDPAILSLGSSRVLWDDAPLVNKRTVLYGNLPSKRFYSDGHITCRQVEERTCELIDRMRAVDHPFILGSECDVLSVPGCEQTIKAKVAAMVDCSCN